MTPAARAGFSLAEALVVLAMTSVLLVLLMQVSTGATRAGFHTAARADAAGERRVGLEALRTLLRGVRLPERGRSPTPFSGDADGFTAAVVSDRPTPCGDEGPATVAVRLAATEGGGTRLVCTAPGGRTAVLAELSTSPAAFSYALAGRPWSERLTAELPPERQGAPAAPRARLWIRFGTAGGTEVVEAVDAPPATARAASGVGA